MELVEKLQILENCRHYLINIEKEFCLSINGPKHTTEKISTLTFRRFYPLSQENLNGWIMLTELFYFEQALSKRAERNRIGKMI